MQSALICINCYSAWGDSILRVVCAGDNWLITIMMWTVAEASCTSPCPLIHRSTTVLLRRVFMACCQVLVATLTPLLLTLRRRYRRRQSRRGAEQATACTAWPSVWYRRLFPILQYSAWVMQDPAGHVPS